MGIIYIFVFLNDADEPTRWKYVIYYTIYEVENVVMMVMWHLYSDPTSAYYLPGECGWKAGKERKERKGIRIKAEEKRRNGWKGEERNG